MKVQIASGWGPHWKVVLTNTMKVLGDFGYMVDLIKLLKVLKTIK